LNPDFLVLRRMRWPLRATGTKKMISFSAAGLAVRCTQLCSSGCWGRRQAWRQGWTLVGLRIPRLRLGQPLLGMGRILGVSSFCFSYIHTGWPDWAKFIFRGYFIPWISLSMKFDKNWLGYILADFSHTHLVTLFLHPRCICTDTKCTHGDFRTLKECNNVGKNCSRDHYYEILVFGRLTFGIDSFFALCKPLTCQCQVFSHRYSSTAMA
jgi:hypothetical protein